MPADFWTARPIWPAETCFIVGGGPSLVGFDFEKLRGRNVIAVNSSVFSVPFAQFCFFGDDRWGQENSPRLKEYGGTIVTTARGGLVPQAVRMQKITPPPPLASDRSTVVMDRTSLHAAINLAVHFDVARIVLLGADMKASPSGVTHHHRPHPWPSSKSHWDLQLKQLELLPAELLLRRIEVVNTSLESRISWWPKRPIDEVLR